MMLPYSKSNRIMVLKIKIQASVVKYLQTFDKRYNSCDTILQSSSICLLKFRCSSIEKPRYLYEHVYMYMVVQV